MPANLNGMLREINVSIRQMDERFDRLDERLNGMDQRFGEVAAIARNNHIISVNRREDDRREDDRREDGQLLPLYKTVCTDASGRWALTYHCFPLTAGWLVMDSHLHKLSRITTTSDNDWLHQLNLLR
jgi:hypothetical protein